MKKKLKKTLFNRLLPNIKVITLKLWENKDEIVNPVGNILIDDSISNVNRWRNAGGIGLLFKKDESNILEDEINDLNKVLKLKK